MKPALQKPCQARNNPGSTGWRFGKAKHQWLGMEAVENKMLSTNILKPHKFQKKIMIQRCVFSSILENAVFFGEEMCVDTMMFINPS